LARWDDLGDKCKWIIDPKWDIADYLVTDCGSEFSNANDECEAFTYCPFCGKIIDNKYDVEGVI
jgi:hypothetical protein